MERTPRDDSFPWPWRDADTRRVSLITFCFLAAINVWGVIAIDFLPISRKSPWDPSANQRAPLFARYDSGWYDSIVRFGYREPPLPGKESAHAFFPLYPEIARFFHLATGLDSFQSALLVTYLSLIFAMPLFLDEARRRLGEAHRWDGPTFLFLYPVAFFLAACYTESLYLLLVLLAFRAVRLDQPYLAVLLGLLTGLTRAPAAALAPALAIAWFFARTGPRRFWALAIGAAPVLGVFGWIFGIGWAKGEILLFFRSMQTWRHSASSLAGGPLAFVEELHDQITGYGYLAGPGGQVVKRRFLLAHPGALMPWIHFFGISAIATFQLVKKRWADAVWTLGVLGLSVLTGTSAGIPRYTLTIFPAMLVLAEVFGTKRAWKLAFLGVTAALLLVQAAFFTNWHFVS